MKSKKQKVWVDCDIFKVTPLFLINYSPAEYRKEISKYAYLDESELDLDELEYADGQQSTFSPTKDTDVNILRCIWIREFKKNDPESLGVLIHEIVHLVNRIHRHKGIPFDGEQNNDETFAYMVDYFTRKVLTKLNEN